MRSRAPLLPVLALLGSMGQVMADLYLPSLPFISTNLAVSVNSVQWSISVYMWGFALSQLVYGQLSDAVGRKLPLLVGILLTLVGSAVCLFAPSIAWLIAGRFIQGLGAGSGVTLSRVILRDIYSGNKLAKFASYLSVTRVPIMAGAPLLGGIIQHFLGWRENFIFLTLYAVVALLVVVIFLDETNVNRNMKHLHWRHMLTNIATLAKSPLFIGLSLIIFLTYGGILAWIITVMATIAFCSYLLVNNLIDVSSKAS